MCRRHLLQAAQGERLYGLLVRDGDLDDVVDKPEEAGHLLRREGRHRHLELAQLVRPGEHHSEYGIQVPVGQPFLPRQRLREVRQELPRLVGERLQIRQDGRPSAHGEWEEQVALARYLLYMGPELGVMEQVTCERFQQLPPVMPVIDEDRPCDFPQGFAGEAQRCQSPVPVRLVERDVKQDLMEQIIRQLIEPDRHSEKRQARKEGKEERRKERKKEKGGAKALSYKRKRSRG